MAKKFVQTYQVSFAKSLDISKDYKKKHQPVFPKVSLKFELEIEPKSLFNQENYLLPKLLPYNLDAETYEDDFKTSFEYLKSSTRSFKTEVIFWSDNYYRIIIKFPKVFGDIQNLKFFPKQKSIIKSKKNLEARLTTFHYIKTYGFFGKNSKVIEKVRKRFRKKYLARKNRKRAKDVEELENIKLRFQKNFQLALAWGETDKSFVPTHRFNSFIGWSKSKSFKLGDRFGEVV